MISALPIGITFACYKFTWKVFAHGNGEKELWCAVQEVKIQTGSRVLIYRKLVHEYLCSTIPSI